MGLHNDHGQALIDSTLISNSTGYGLLNDTGTMVITGSTITRNPGGGARNNLSSDGNGLTVINSLFSENTDNPAGLNGAGGGAIANYGSQLTITGSTFLSNSATSLPGAQGGAIWSFLGLGLSITNSTFAGNTQGALYNEGGSFAPTVTLSIASSLFANNQGGAIANIADNLSIISSTFAGNVSADNGGAVNSASSSLLIAGSSFYSNTTTKSGGAVENSVSPMTVTNSTFWGNQAADNGGAIWLFSSSATLNNVTIAGNTAGHSHIGVGGGGLVALPAVSITIANTIIAGNIDLGSLAPDCAGTLTTGGHNLIQSTAGCTLSGTATGDITGTAALLGPLQDNGGPTWTQALLPGSPALDAGSPAAPGSGAGACEAADQRGIARPQGLACDIGAYEAAGPSPTATVQFTSSHYSAPHSAGTVPITVTLSGPLLVTATVQYSTTNGTALAGLDYVAADGTLTFTPGLTQTAFAVALLPVTPGGPDRDFSMTLISPTVAALGAPATATVTLHNDAPLPAVRFSGAVYTVGESSGSATITVTLSAASGLTATVHYATSNGTATAGSDYTPVSGTLTFAPGQVQQVFTVPITNDVQAEPSETVLLMLSSPSQAVLGSPSAASLTILDDDLEFRLYLSLVRR